MTATDQERAKAAKSASLVADIKERLEIRRKNGSFDTLEELVEQLLGLPQLTPSDIEDEDARLIAKLRDSATFISDHYHIRDKVGGWSSLRHAAANRIEQQAVRIRELEASPSGDVRGLIERLRAGASTSNSVSMHMRKYQDLCDEAAAALERLSTPSSPVSGEGERPKRVVLCGSSRFVDVMAVCAWLIERDENAISMALHLLPQWYPNLVLDHLAEAENVAGAMDALHLRKIELADEIFVVNRFDYIGSSTANEIAHATALGKPIRYYTGDPVGAAVENMIEDIAPSRPPEPAVSGEDWLKPDPITLDKVREWRAKADKLLHETMEGPYSVIVALADYILHPPEGDVRKTLRQEMLRVETTGRRETYADGFQQGLCRAIELLGSSLPVPDDETKRLREVEHRKRRGGETQWSGWQDGPADFKALGNGWEVRTRPIYITIASRELDHIINGVDLFEALFAACKGAVPDELTEAALERIAADIRDAIDSAALAPVEGTKP